MSVTTSGDEAKFGPPTLIQQSNIKPQTEFYQLPEHPLITIEASRSWEGMNPLHLWSYRELIYFLAWRDLKLRYKQTALGIVWVILQPVLGTIIFTIFLGRLVGVPSENVPYILFAYAGLMIWIFFSGAISATGSSLVGNAHLITKVYFPRFIIPIATILARFADLAVAFVIMAGLLIYFHRPISATILLAPVVILLVALLALGFGMWTSAINVKYRDVGLALPVLIQLWMFVSPVVYPLSFVPEKWRTIYSLNPLVGLIDTFRAVLFNRPINFSALMISITVTLLLLMYAAYAFRNREKTFADIV